MGKVYETAIKIGASISRTFKRDTDGAAASLRKLTEDTKKLKAAEQSASAFKKLDEAVRKSKAHYDQAAASLRKLEDAEKAAGGATKESTQWTKAGQRAVAAAAREMDRATKAAEKNAKALHELGVDTSKLEKEQRRLAAASRYATERERLFGAQKSGEPESIKDRLKSKVGKAGGQLRGIATDAALLGTAAVGAGAAMAGLMMKSLSTADEIGDTAGKLQISTDALQEFRHAVRQSGGESEDLDKSLGKMLVNIGKFKNAKPKGGDGATGIAGLELLPDSGEGGDAAGESDPFKRIGLSAKKLAALKPEQQIRKIMDGLKTLKTAADRAAIGQAIFGKTGAVLAAMSEEGASKLDELSKEAHKYGGVISTDVIGKADKADQAMKDAELAVTGLTTTLGAALLPTATKVFKQFSQWVANNRENIQKWAETAAKWIEGKALPAIVKFGREFGSFASSIMSGATKLANLVGGFDRLAIILAGLRFAPLVKSLGEIAVEGTKAAAALFRMAAAKQAAGSGGGLSLPGGGGGGGAATGALGKAGEVVKALPLIGAGVSVAVVAGNALKERFGENATPEALEREGKGAAADWMSKQAAQRGRGAAQAASLFQSLGLLPSTVAGGGRTQINIGDVNIGTPEMTREQFGTAMKTAENDAWEKYQKKRARVAFAE